MIKEESKLFGLVGKNISYSFSKGYFSKKFTDEKLQHHQYVNFDIQSIEDFQKLIHKYKFQLKGMNVTIPYKQEIIPFLDKLDKTAKKIGAVNTIKITKKGNLKGYNTDVIGFSDSLKPMLAKQHKKALILGTGGASKAVAFALKQLGIKHKFVSRNPLLKKEISYTDLNNQILSKYLIIINTTPLGTFPDVHKSPSIPYEFLTSNHILYDLVYNPEETAFLSKGKAQGATIKNGLEMLHLQAEAAWKIWNT